MRNKLLALLFALSCAVGSADAQTITAHAVNSKLKNNLEVTGTLKVDGSTTLGGATPVVTTGNANGQVAKSKWLNENIQNGSVANATTYKLTIAPGRACTITQIAFSCITAPVDSSGTSTIAITKNGSTSVLSTSTVNAASAMASGTATTATLATGAAITLAATDILEVVYTAATTQSTAGVAPSVNIEVLPSDY